MMVYFMENPIGMDEMSRGAPVSESLHILGGSSHLISGELVTGVSSGTYNEDNPTVGDLRSPGLLSWIILQVWVKTLSFLSFL